MSLHFQVNQLSVEKVCFIFQIQIILYNPVSTISLLNSKGEFKSMEPCREFCCLHKILCIACMYFIHSFEELYVIWLVEDGRMMFLNEKYHHSCCPLYGSLNSKHPNSQAKLWQFKCSRPLSQWRTIVPSRATEETGIRWTFGAACHWGGIWHHGNETHVQHSKVPKILWMQFFENGLISLGVFTRMPFPSLIMPDTCSPFRTLLMCHLL